MIETLCIRKLPRYKYRKLFSNLKKQGAKKLASNLNSHGDIAFSMRYLPHCNFESHTFFSFCAHDHVCTVKFAMHEVIAKQKRQKESRRSPRISVSIAPNRRDRRN